MQGILEKKYEIKSQRIGKGVDSKGVEKLKEGQVLNRVLRHTEEGYELEADLRHAELIIEQLDISSAKTVVTPGVDLDVECAVWDDEPEGEMLPSEECTRF